MRETRDRIERDHDTALRFYLRAIEMTQDDVSRSEYLTIARRIVDFHGRTHRFQLYDTELRRLEEKYKDLLGIR